MTKNFTKEDLETLAQEVEAGRKLSKEEVDEIVQFIDLQIESMLFEMQKMASEMWPDTHPIKH